MKAAAAFSRHPRIRRRVWPDLRRFAHLPGHPWPLNMGVVDKIINQVGHLLRWLRLPATACLSLVMLLLCQASSQEWHASSTNVPGPVLAYSGVSSRPVAYGHASAWAGCVGRSCRRNSAVHRAGAHARAHPAATPACSHYATSRRSNRVVPGMRLSMHVCQQHPPCRLLTHPACALTQPWDWMKATFGGGGSQS